MFIKMLGNGIQLYFANSFNKFDFFVIFVSTVDLLLANIKFA